MTESDALALAQKFADDDGKPWSIYRLTASPHVYTARGPWDRVPSQERYQLVRIIQPTPGSEPVVRHGFGCACCPRKYR